jgi:hypothetical protein
MKPNTQATYIAYDVYFTPVKGEQQAIHLKVLAKIE